MGHGGEDQFKGRLHAAAAAAAAGSDERSPGDDFQGKTRIASRIFMGKRQGDASNIVELTLATALLITYMEPLI